MNAYVPLFLKPSPGTTDQQLTVDATAGGLQLSAFSAHTEIIMFQIQNADVRCTLDGSAPTTTNGFILEENSKYNWTKSMAAAAKFIRTDATSAVIHAQECVPG